MFKISAPFIRSFLLALFLFSPSFVFAWNSTCWSPVQRAALLQKPKKTSGLTTGSLRKRVRGLERAIEKARGQLDEATGLLEDSLDEGRLGADPSDVAGEIADYIESQQDGWDCDTPGGSVLTLLPPLLELLETVFTPPVFAEPLKIEGEQEDPPLVGAEDPYGEQKALCRPYGTWDDKQKTCICRDKNKAWDGENCVQKPQATQTPEPVLPVKLKEPQSIQPVKLPPTQQQRPPTGTKQRVTPPKPRPTPQAEEPAPVQEVLKPRTEPRSYGPSHCDGLF